MKKKIKIVLVIGIVIVALLFVTHAILDAVWSAELREKLAELERSGEPFRLTDFAPPMPSEEENAAQIWNTIWSQLTWSELSEGEYGREAFNRFSSNGSVSDEDRGTLQELLNRHAALFEMARQNLTRPRCVYDLKYEDAYAMLLPHLSKSLRFSKMLALRACLEPETWEEDCRLLISLGESLREEPLLVSQLVRGVIYSRLWELLKKSMEEGVPSTRRRDLIELLSKTGTRIPLSRILQLERACGMKMFSDGLENLSMLADASGRTTWFREVPTWIARPLVKREFARFLDFNRKAIDSVSKTPLEARPALQKLEQEIQSLDGDPFWMFADCFCVSVTKASDNLLEMDVNHLLARISLGDGEVSAVDPFDGKPMRSRDDGEFRILWSVGRNGVDDGGGDEEGPDGQPMDIVWRVKK